MWDYQTDPRVAIPKAIAEAEIAISVCPNLWYGYAVRATCHLFERRWDLAGEFFDMAISRDRSEAERFIWFAAYRLSQGHHLEAVELVARRALERPLDPMAHADLALYLYLRRSREVARTCA